MSSIGEVVAVIGQGIDAMSQGQGGIAHALDQHRTALAALQQAGEGSHQADVEALRAQLQHVVSTLEDLMGQSHRCIDESEQFRARL